MLSYATNSVLFRLRLYIARCGCEICLLITLLRLRLLDKIEEIGHNDATIEMIQMRILTDED